MQTIYTLIRSARKSMSIEVKTDGSVIVRAPKKMPVREIENILNQKKEWIADAKKRQEEREVTKAAAQLCVEDIKRLSNEAMARLPDIVQHYAAIMNVKPEHISITSAQKRLGSCSVKKNLCFSYRLMLYPDNIIEYVVVHELAHLRYMNHGAEFHAFIESVIPEHRKLEKLLKAL